MMKIILEFNGTSLVDAVIDTNKYSNNVMARQIFPTTALESGATSVFYHRCYFAEMNGENSTVEYKKSSYRKWFGTLSDIERMSPKQMTDLLDLMLTSSKNKEIFRFISYP
jgi:D-alanyl-D-alanine carboxypeptidase/D-alanyl-D-alanine-endopeptidase (penicillin-binding protein 4)